MTDPIADMLIRIKNAHLARKEAVQMPYSKIKANIAKLLEQEGYVTNVATVAVEGHQQLAITLKYVGKTPAITDVKRVSTPGRRLYASARDIPRALGGYGITVVSTHKGVMTDTQARKQNAGGEVLCQIW
jgi:small subunit ribosomal protein S8